ncbi:hypothetical protein FXO38_36720 [Capsicum annuum]|nr:hypothetical protein FXO38_36720 [Capsicum annuum]
MAISWTSLKSIKMKEICCEHVVKLLAGCPNLEVMELKSVKAFGRLEINSLKLKKLYLEDLCMDDEEPISPWKYLGRIFSILKFQEFLKTASLGY